MTSIEEWKKKLKKEIVEIEKLEAKDRLQATSSLMYLNASLASSVSGWHSWLTNAMIMEKFSREELEELVERFRKVTLDFLLLDLEYTDKLKERGTGETSPKKNYMV